MGGRALQRKLISILVSILLSFFLWLILAGKDTSITEITVPLELQNLSKDLLILNEVPKSIVIQLQANMAQLRFIDDRRLKNLALDVGEIRDGYNAITIEADLLDLPRGVRVSKITPTVIELEAVKVTNKMVNLKTSASGELNKDYRLKSIVIEPDTVNLRGQEDILDSIDYLTTTPIPLDGVTKDFTITVTPLLSDLPHNLIVSPREIKATVSVEEIKLEATFKNINIDPIIKGSKVTNLKMSPSKADVSVAWPASRVNALTASDLRVQVTVNEDALNKHEELTLPLVVVAPPGVSITAINPNNVIIKNSALINDDNPK